MRLVMEKASHQSQLLKQYCRGFERSVMNNKEDSFKVFNLSPQLLIEQQAIVFGLVNENDNDLISGLYVTMVDDTRHYKGLFTHPNERGKAHATKLVMSARMRMCEFGEGFDQAVVRIFNDGSLNESSARVLLKSGFEAVGEPVAMQLENGFADAHLMDSADEHGVILYQVFRSKSLQRRLEMAA